MTRSWPRFVSMSLLSILATFGSSSPAFALSRFDQRTLANTPNLQVLDDAIARQKVLINDVHAAETAIIHKGKYDADGLLPPPLNLPSDITSVAEAYLAAQKDRAEGNTWLWLSDNAKMVVPFLGESGPGKFVKDLDAFKDVSADEIEYGILQGREAQLYRDENTMEFQRARLTGDTTVTPSIYEETNRILGIDAQAITPAEYQAFWDGVAANNASETDVLALAGHNALVDGGAGAVVQFCGGIAGIDPNALLGPLPSSDPNALSLLDVQIGGTTQHFTLDGTSADGVQASSELFKIQQTADTVKAINDASAQSYDTPNGPRTLTEITDELEKAGYPGPWDAESAVSTYRRVAQQEPTPTSAPTVTPQPTVTAQATAVPPRPTAAPGPPGDACAALRQAYLQAENNVANSLVTGQGQAAAEAQAEAAFAKMVACH